MDNEIGSVYSSISGATHPALTLTGENYLSLSVGTQVLTANAINLASSNVTGILPVSNGGIGLDTSTAPSGTLLLGTGTGWNVKAMGGDASIDNTGTLTLADSGVGAGTYGSATGVPIITVDSKGRITSSSTAPLLNITDGSGIANYIARWTDDNTLSTGTIYDNGTQVGIGTTNPLYTLDINEMLELLPGRIYTSEQLV